MIKVGMGYDVHQLAPGKPLLIGGVKVSSSKGSVGHSDGDALSMQLQMQFWALEDLVI